MFETCTANLEAFKRWETPAKLTDPEFLADRQQAADRLADATKNLKNHN
jgi:hypothetical protein